MSRERWEALAARARINREYRAQGVPLIPDLAELEDLAATVEHFNENGSTQDYITAASNFTDALVLRLVEDVLSRQPKPIEEIAVPVRHRVRKHARDTSWDAAVEQSSEKARQTYFRIYHALLAAQVDDRKGLTDYELRDHFTELDWAHSESGVRARRSELVDAGWVRPLRIDGETVKRPSPSGRPSIVWEAVKEVWS